VEDNLLRKTPLLLTAALMSGALLAGCSGSGSSPSALPGSGNTMQSQSHVRSNSGLERTGVAPKFLSLLKFGHTRVRPNKTGKPPKDLAVSDFGTGDVEVLDKTYNPEQNGFSGLNGPDGDWFDSSKSESMYVANYAGITVQEYQNDGTSPAFTYTSGLGDPIGVTTDKALNVFVADYGSGSASSVFEFPPKNNSPISCATGLSNEGVAVDAAGDVFVDGNNPNTGQGDIIEYAGGLSGCKGTTLGVHLGFAGGMVIDKSGTLIAIDQFVGPMVIPSPYTSGTACGSGYSDPFHDALNKKENLLFVADVGAAVVDVYTYPGCTFVQSLGSANGLSDPAGVASLNAKDPKPF